MIQQAMHDSDRFVMRWSALAVLLLLSRRTRISTSVKTCGAIVSVKKTGLRYYAGITLRGDNGRNARYVTEERDRGPSDKPWVTGTI